MRPHWFSTTHLNFYNYKQLHASSPPAVRADLGGLLPKQYLLLELQDRILRPHERPGLLGLRSRSGQHQ